MKTRKLRNIEVSAIGMGCMGFTHAYGKAPEEKEAIRLVHRAFELGCTFFDTAEMYSFFKNEEFVGKAIEITTRRKGALLRMDNKGDRTHLDFDIPARGLMGLRSNLLTATQGEAVVAHRFKDYEPYKGDIERRTNGSLVSLETGVAVAYSMDKLQDRGRFFVNPGDEIYAGQVVGEHTRERDLNINICKTKKLTNMRASGSDDKVMLPPPIVFSLEEALEYIQEDELVEVTPKSMRIRKIILDEIERKRKSNDLD